MMMAAPLLEQEALQHQVSETEPCCRIQIWDRRRSSFLL